jgi:hypothetical protein
MGEMLTTIECRQCTGPEPVTFLWNEPGAIGLLSHLVKNHHVALRNALGFMADFLERHGDPE